MGAMKVFIAFDSIVYYCVSTCVHMYIYMCIYTKKDQNPWLAYTIASVKIITLILRGTKYYGTT